MGFCFDPPLAAAVQAASGPAERADPPVVLRQAPVTNSNHGTWLFAPNQNQGNGS
jgi:hypothetical protein